MRIPYMLIRGGGVNNIYFSASDLPKRKKERDRVIAAALNSAYPGEVLQSFGHGELASASSRVAIVKKARNPNPDYDSCLLQVVIGEGRASDMQNNGNILAGILPFAIENGLLFPTHPSTVAMVQIMNNGNFCELTVNTPVNMVSASGMVIEDGLAQKEVPVLCNYLDIAGSNCGDLLPTGSPVNVVDGIEVSCIDNGMPVVCIRAEDLGISGYEGKVLLDAKQDLKDHLEQIRLKVGSKMNLGRVSKKTVPKMCLISAPLQGGVINTRTFLPYTCQAALGVRAAFSVAAACRIPGTIAHSMAHLPLTGNDMVIEHAGGKFTVNLESRKKEGMVEILKSGTVRSARIMGRDEVFIPEVALAV